MPWVSALVLACTVLYPILSSSLPQLAYRAFPFALVSLLGLTHQPVVFQITNATTLQKTVDHLGKLQQDRQQMQEEARRLREEIEELNSSIR